MSGALYRFVLRELRRDRLIRRARRIRAARQWMRKHPDPLCYTCGYNLGAHLHAAICPECGRTINWDPTWWEDGRYGPVWWIACATVYAGLLLTWSLGTLAIMLMGFWTVGLPTPLWLQLSFVAMELVGLHGTMAGADVDVVLFFIGSVEMSLMLSDQWAMYVLSTSRTRRSASIGKRYAVISLIHVVTLLLTIPLYCWAISPIIESAQ